ncbi:MAG TPA: hypothetical protein VJR47_15720 [Stellaceae bacterium]|nr:hypothetical protein [Stellaceae bacterium]
MASPRPDRSGGGAGALRRATVLRTAPRPPRAANDNPASFAYRLFRIFPFLMALVLLTWALWNLGP